MNCIRVVRRHLQIGERELGRIGEARHSLIPMSTGQNDGVPLMMHLGRRGAQIGNRSIQHPGAASVGVRGVAAVAYELAVKEFALMNCFLARSLLRRLWYWRNDIGRRRKRRSGPDLKGQQSCGPAFRLWSSHSPGGSEQPGTRTPSHG